MTIHFLHHRRPANTTWDIIAWWENLRWIYNLLVGAAGLIPLGLLFLVFLAFDPARSASHILYFFTQFAFAAAIYGGLANILYTTGWISEILLRNNLSTPTDDYAKIAFVCGTVFSVLLTLIPAVLILIFATVAKILGTNF